jgi:hypothetical protein
MNDTHKQQVIREAAALFGLLGLSIILHFVSGGEGPVQILTTVLFYVSLILCTAFNIRNYRWWRQDRGGRSPS